MGRKSEINWQEQLYKALTSKAGGHPVQGGRTKNPGIDWSEQVFHAVTDVVSSLQDSIGDVEKALDAIIGEGGEA